MKRIINGRMWDDAFMNNIAQRTFCAIDPVTGETKTYHEELKREYVLKPGHTLADTWVKGEYGGRSIVQGNCDLSKGPFVLKTTQGWGDGTFRPITDAEARDWLEKWCPDQTDLYEEMFGQADSPWTGDGTVGLVAKAESDLSSMKWRKEREEERADAAEAEVARLKDRLEKIERYAANVASGLPGGNSEPTVSNPSEET